MKKVKRQTLEALRSALDRQTVASLLSFIGYEVQRDYKFRLRDEKTASTSISASGYIKDFGSGWGGDFIDLLQEYKGMSFIEAVEYTAKALNIEVDYE